MLLRPVNRVVALEGCSPGPRRCRSLPSPWKVSVQGLVVFPFRRHSLSAVAARQKSCHPGAFLSRISLLSFVVIHKEEMLD